MVCFAVFLGETQNEKDSSFLSVLEKKHKFIALGISNTICLLTHLYSLVYMPTKGPCMKES